METIIAAVITGGITLLGVLIANGKTQAVMQVKVDELTREVREHNNFAKRMPVVENQLKTLRKQTSLVKRRIHIIQMDGLWKKIMREALLKNMFMNIIQ